MPELPYDEKLRVLSLRADRNTWELIAEMTHHRKSRILAVNRWLNSLPWDLVTALPEPIQRLRSDYIDLKLMELEEERRLLHPQVRVARGTAVIPAETERIYHGMGTQPDSVSFQLLDGPVLSHVALGSLTPEYFEARAATSGPIVAWQAFSPGTDSAGTNPPQEPTSVGSREFHH